MEEHWNWIGRRECGGRALALAIPILNKVLLKEFILHSQFFVVIYRCLVVIYIVHRDWKGKLFLLFPKLNDTYFVHEYNHSVPFGRKSSPSKQTSADISIRLELIPKHSGIALIFQVHFGIQFHWERSWVSLAIIQGDFLDYVPSRTISKWINLMQ